MLGRLRVVGVPMLEAERISCSGPKLSDAQTRNFEAIKHSSAAHAHGPLCASAGRERGRRPWLSAARGTDPRSGAVERKREDTDDGHAPGRPRETCMPPATRMAGPTRAPRHPCPWRGPTPDEPALAWLVRTARRQVNSMTKQLLRIQVAISTRSCGIRLTYYPRTPSFVN